MGPSGRLNMPIKPTANTPVVSSTTKKAGLLGGVAASIIAGILAVEGGYVANKNDPGGETDYGVTEVVARQHGYTGVMKDLPKSLAVSIYNQDYIIKPGYGPFLDLSPAVAEKLANSAVNVGPGRSSIWLQTSLNAFSQGGKSYTVMPIDGKVNDKAVKAYQALQKSRGKVLACQLIIKSLDAQQGQYYLTISLSNPKLQSFTAGWVANRIGNVPLSKCG